MLVEDDRIIVWGRTDSVKAVHISGFSLGKMFSEMWCPLGYATSSLQMGRCQTPINNQNCYTKIMWVVAWKCHYVPIIWKVIGALMPKWVKRSHTQSFSGGLTICVSVIEMRRFYWYQLYFKLCYWKCLKVFWELRGSVKYSNCWPGKYFLWVFFSFVILYETFCFSSLIVSACC